MKDTHLADNQIRGDFVFLRADNLRLLFPLSDVVNTAYSEPSRSNEDRHSFMDSDASGAEYEMHENIAISNDLTVLSKIPDDRFILAQMSGLDVQLCWNEMTILTDELLTLTDIPPHLLDELTPLRTLVTLDEKPVFLCNTTTFLAYIFPQKVSEI